MRHRCGGNAGGLGMAPTNDEPICVLTGSSPVKHSERIANGMCSFEAKDITGGIGESQRRGDRQCK